MAVFERGSLMQFLIFFLVFFLKSFHFISTVFVQRQSECFESSESCDLLFVQKKMLISDKLVQVWVVGTITGAQFSFLAPAAAFLPQAGCRPGLIIKSRSRKAKLCRWVGSGMHVANSQYWWVVPAWGFPPMSRPSSHQGGAQPLLGHCPCRRGGEGGQGKGGGKVLEGETRSPEHDSKIVLQHLHKVCVSSPVTFQQQCPLL